MSFEDIESTIETVAETAEQDTEQAVEQAAENGRLSAFQNPVYQEPRDLMPKIRFTTDKAEADAAAQADRSDPFHLPDAVFYVGDQTKGGAGSDTAAPVDIPVETFQNPSFGIDVSTFSHEEAGISVESVSLRLESDKEHLSFAQEQLNLAIERGTGVLPAMRGVESAQAVLDADRKLYNELSGAGDGAPSLAASQSDAEGKLGSVSHAKWELEKAYESGSEADIRKAKRHLAEEKAKEDAKKMGV